MFSVREKQLIAETIEKLLLGLNHPEMPTEKPRFTLHVDGKASWSWADITPNWMHSEGESNNPWNEQSHAEIESKKGFLDKVLP